MKIIFDPEKTQVEIYHMRKDENYKGCISTSDHRVMALLDLMCIKYPEIYSFYNPEEIDELNFCKTGIVTSKLYFFEDVSTIVITRDEGILNEYCDELYFTFEQETAED